MRALRLLTAAILIGFPWESRLSAQVIIDVNTTLNTAYSVLNNDLLQTDLQATTSVGDFQAFGGAGLPVLHDGGFVQAGPVFSETAFAGNGYELTYVLSNPSGYNISQINTYAGWDAFRGGQAYTVAYDTVTSPGTYVSIGSVSYDPTGGGNVSSRIQISNTTGDLATDVRSIRFTFAGVTADQAGYREIDVVGVAVPEPKSAFLSASVLLMFLVVRSQKQRFRRTTEIS
jgi:hypothetical protein